MVAGTGRRGVHCPRVVLPGFGGELRKVGTYGPVALGLCAPVSRLWTSYPNATPPAGYETGGTFAVEVGGQTHVRGMRRGIESHYAHIDSVFDCGAVRSLVVVAAGERCCIGRRSIHRGRRGK